MNYSQTTGSSAADVVLGTYAAVATGDFEAARGALHPGLRLHVPGTHPLAGVHDGVDAFFGFLVDSRALTENGEDVEIIDVLEGERHVAVYCTVRADRHGKAPLVNHTIHLVRVEDGLVTEIWLHNFDDLAVNDFWS